tara:strand:+ start:2065 stop:2718 length:654 start_codon:yes stop_codon:yes gene_type:complete
LAKRISDKQKEEIIQSFIKGLTIDQIANIHNFTKITIVRNIKKFIGNEKYKRILQENKSKLISSCAKDNNNNYVKKVASNSNTDEQFNSSENLLNASTFVEIKPICTEFDDLSQKDLSSIPIKSIEFPKVVYLIISNKFELQPKLLKDYPNWGFLPLDDLERKTIEIFHDIKSAKQSCNNDQKVIKVPNTNLLKIVAPILVSRGISRIINNDELVAL